MATWIFPSNSRTFDASGALRALGEVTWSQLHRHEVGDTVYLYAAQPVQAIIAKCVVTAIDQAYEEAPDEVAYWGDHTELDERAHSRTWMRLRAVTFFDGDKNGPLGIDALRAHGFALFNGRSRPQAPLLDYLDQFDTRRQPGDDVTAETAEYDPGELAALRKRAERGDYTVPDRTATTKTRGSAQRVFAEAVKRNYGHACAVTGIRTQAFLVASHIVPWSDDETTRTDPRNGICLSTFVDRAFDTDYLHINGDLVVHVNWDTVGDDDALRAQLEPYDGTKLAETIGIGPDPAYLKRRFSTPPSETSESSGSITANQRSQT